MGTGGSFPGGKVRPGRDADRTPSSSAMVKKEELYLLSLKAPFMACSGSTLLSVNSMCNRRNETTCIQI
jgi:hypothetical protein